MNPAKPNQTLCEIFMSEKQKHYPGCYRFTLPHGFAQIKKQNNGWLVELRDSDGTLIRFGGAWRTLKEAIASI